MVSWIRRLLRMLLFTRAGLAHLGQHPRHMWNNEDRGLRKEGRAQWLQVLHDEEEIFRFEYLHVGPLPQDDWIPMYGYWQDRPHHEQNRQQYSIVVSHPLSENCQNSSKDHRGKPAMAKTDSTTHTVHTPHSYSHKTSRIGGASAA